MIRRKLYSGVVLDKIPVPLEYLRHDMIKPRGNQWFVDELEEDHYMLTLKVGLWVRSVKWVGPRTIDNKKFLKKLLLRWYWEDRGVFETKPHDRYPFPYWEYHRPIDVYQTQAKAKEGEAAKAVLT